MAVEISTNMLILIIASLILILLIGISLYYFYKTGDFFYFAREVCLLTVGKIFAYSEVCKVFSW